MLKNVVDTQIHENFMTENAAEIKIIIKKKLMNFYLIIKSKICYHILSNKC